MEQISDARVYENMTSLEVDSDKLKKETKELEDKIHKLISDYVEACKANGDVDEGGKVRFFPKICDTPDLILEKFPMTEEQILSVKDYDTGLLYDAIAFLRGENKGKLFSTMYLCVYVKYHGLKEL